MASGWAYVGCADFATGSGPTGSVQFHTYDTSISGSENFMFHTASVHGYAASTLVLTGALVVSGAISASSYTIKNVYNIHSSGSTEFGNSSDDFHKFTGSVLVKGPLVTNGLAGEHAIFNEAGLDIDFRVESVDETHMIFVEGSSNRVSIGDSTDAPAATLEIANASDGGVPLLILDSNDTDKMALHIDAANIDADVVDIEADAVTTANVIDITADGLTSGAALNITSTSTSTTAGSVVKIAATGNRAHDSNAVVGLDIDFDSTAGTAARAFRIDSEQTTGIVAELSADALTTGKGVNVTSTSNGLSGANLLYANASGTSTDAYSVAKIVKDHANLSDSNAIVGLDIDFDGAAGTAGRAFRIDSEQTTGVVAEINGDALTTGTGVDLSADALTTGNGVNVTSTSNGLSGANLLYANASGTSTDAYSVAKIVKDHANLSDSNAIVGLDIDFDGAAGTAGRALRIDSEQTTGIVAEIDGNALTTGAALDISTAALTTGYALHVDDNSANTSTRNSVAIAQEEGAAIGATALNVSSHGGITGIALDKNFSDTTAATVTGLSVDLDKTGTSTSNNTIYGINVDVDNTTATNGSNTMVGLHVTPKLIHAADAGTPIVKGAVIWASGSIYGTSTSTGMELTSAGADTNNGLIINCADGGTDFKAVSSADTADFFSISTTTNGATTLTTVDGGAAAANLTFTVDGTITQTAAGLIKLDGGGVEIENDDGTDESALLIDNNDAGEIALDIDAANTTANVIDVAATALTTGKALFIDAGNATTTSTAAGPIVHVDFDKTGIVASGQTSTFIGLDLDMNDAATNVGTSTMTGMDLDVVAASAGGTVSNIGLDVNVAGADTNYAALFRAGKVGIGTATPTAELQVRHPGAGNDSSILLTRGGLDDYGMKLTADTTSGHVYIDSIGDSSSPNMYFRMRTNGTDVNAMTIDGAGKVGIGTTTPISALEIEDGLTTVGAVLTLGTKEPTVVADDVLGRINFYAPLDTGLDSDEIGASIAAIAQATFSDTVNSTALVFQTGKSEVATTKMRIDEDGLVSIGPTSRPGTTSLTGSLTTLTINKSADISYPTMGPAAFAGLHLEPSVVTDGYSMGITFGAGGDGSLATHANKTQAGVWSEADSSVGSNLTFGTANSWSTGAEARMTISPAGNVGIGTMTPISTLEIEAGLTTVGAVLTLGTKEPTVVANDVLGRINFYAPLDTGLDSDEIGASIAAIAQATFSDTVNSTALHFQTGKSEVATTKMVIDEDGRVGIGTSAPAAALHVDNDDTDLMAFHIDAANIDADVVNIEVAALTTGKALYIDHNDTATTAVTPTTMHIDFDKSGVVADGVTSTWTALDLDMSDAATNHANANVTMTGLDIDVDSASTQGTNTNVGVDIVVTDATTNDGIRIVAENGAGVDLKMISSADAEDYCTIAVGASGETTITTVDHGAAAADLNFVVDGDIILGPAGGDVLPDGDGTRNLGSGAARWANVYTADLHLANERGDWTVIEEENYLTIRSNKTGKRFKLLMEEIED
jgi:hypothetical protein